MQTLFPVPLDHSSVLVFRIARRFAAFYCPVYLRVHHAAFDRGSWSPCVAVGVAGVGR